MAARGLPIFDSMIKQGLLSRNLFAFYMSMSTADKSELTFGSYDADKFVGDIAWHPVVDKLFWSLRLDDIKYNGQPLNICEGRTCMITPDSGTSLMTAPTWAYNELLSALPQVDDC